MLFIHESAHSLDRGKSASREWDDAVALDTCVPDNYTGSSYAEYFAQVVAVSIYLVGKGFGGQEYGCMRNKLQLMSQYLPT
ncbi:unnamed protein product [Rotaria sp. Silwood1]|nr:unnamed protein product [Rotaria sp. Silwood1]CAF3832285.1 unnamed protein product [Rotaria sp. Silwood1]CAF4800171.1 unnamed protein product [Rotaria sp. Silwood1]CAF4838874.1 unnamed protein product [Rotaria sp. Silwood1]